MELRDAVNTQGSPAREAFYRGMAETALQIRERDLQLAEAGSPSADEALKNYLRNMINDL